MKRYQLKSINRQFIFQSLEAASPVHLCMEARRLGDAISTANNNAKLAEVYNTFIKRFMLLIRNDKSRSLYCCVDLLIEEGWHRKIKTALKSQDKK